MCPIFGGNMRKSQKGFTFTELLLIIAILVIVALVAATPWIAEYLWNWVMPQVFGLKKITALQAFQLMLTTAPFLVGAGAISGILVLLTATVLVNGGGALHLKWRDYKLKKRMEERKRSPRYERTN